MNFGINGTEVLTPHLPYKYNRNRTSKEKRNANGVLIGPGSKIYDKWTWTYNGITAEQLGEILALVDPSFLTNRYQITSVIPRKGVVTRRCYLANSQDFEGITPGAIEPGLYNVEFVWIEVDGHKTI